MDKCSKAAAMYVALLQGMSIIHQNAHWLTKGNNFYGDHLLFMRIYESAQENLDSASEKFIGTLGEECLDLTHHTELLNKVLSKYNKSTDDFAKRSLAIEEEFLKFSDFTYDCFEKAGKLTLGIDDLLCAVYSKREESIYLLKQSMA